MIDSSFHLTFQCTPHRGYGYVIDACSSNLNNKLETVLLWQSKRDYWAKPNECVNIDFPHKEKFLDILFLNQLEERISLIVFPLMPKDLFIGLGGTSYSLKTDNVLLEWQSRLPSEWLALQPIIDLLVNEFEC